MRAVSVESAQRLEMLAGGIFTLCGAALRISASLDVRPVPWESVDGARALTGARNGGTATLDDAGQPQEIVTVGLARGQHTETAAWSDRARLRRRGAGTDAREESPAQVGPGCDCAGLRRLRARHSVPHAEGGQGAGRPESRLPPFNHVPRRRIGISSDGFFQCAGRQFRAHSRRARPWSGCGSSHGRSARWWPSRRARRVAWHAGAAF